MRLSRGLGDYFSKIQPPRKPHQGEPLADICVRDQRLCDTCPLGAKKPCNVRELARIYTIECLSLDLTRDKPSCSRESSQGRNFGQEICLFSLILGSESENPLSGCRKEELETSSVRCQYVKAEPPTEWFVVTNRRNMERPQPRVMPHERSNIPSAFPCQQEAQREIPAL